MNRQLLEQLLITQPTVTRSMRKLEEELEVVLFDRKPNKIELTETGILAVQEAKNSYKPKTTLSKKSSNSATKILD